MTTELENQSGDELVSTLRGLLKRSALILKELTNEDDRATYYVCEWFDKTDGELVRRDAFVNIKSGVTSDGVGRF